MRDKRSHPATFAPAGSNRSGRGGNEAAEAFGAEGHVGDLAPVVDSTHGGPGKTGGKRCRMLD